MNMKNIVDIERELALIEDALIGETDLRLVIALWARKDELEEERAFMLFQDAA